MTGFKNAQGVTEFKRGMRVQSGTDAWFLVAHVLARGQVDLAAEKEDQWVIAWREEVDGYILDLDSIWEGRWYKAIRNQQTVTVVAVSEDRVAFTWYVNGLECSRCRTRADFLHNWEPMPLPTGVPTKSPKDHWKPKRGDTVLSPLDGHVEVLATWGDIAWVRRGDHAVNEAIENLRPLPNERPASNKLNRFFSGPGSAWMWNEINNAATVPQLRDALYVVCCRLQELEAQQAQLIPAAEVHDAR